jgi:hypothetical protein
MNPDENKSSSAANEPFAHSAGLLDQFVNPFNALAGMWNTWLQASSSFSLERGSDLGKSLTRLFDPQVWKTGGLSPLIEELQGALSLPPFADLPKVELSMLPASAALLDLVGLMQKFMRVSIPMWAAASQGFQAEVDARTQKGEPVRSPAEALELWNGVLDRTLMEFNRSGEFAQMQRQLVRSAAQYRIALRKIGEQSARSFDMPTRQEMTDVYRRMHDMQREVHKLRQEVRALRGDLSLAVEREAAAGEKPGC